MSSMNLNDFRNRRTSGLGQAGILASLIGIVPALAEAGAVGFSTYSSSKTKEQDSEQRRREFTATMAQRQRELEILREQQEKEALRKSVSGQGLSETVQLTLGAGALIAVTALVFFGLRRK